MSEQYARELVELVRRLRNGSEDFAESLLRVHVVNVRNDAVDAAAVAAMGMAVDADVPGESAKAIGEGIRLLKWSA